MSRTQLDMFAGQGDLFPAAPVAYRADPDRVRRKLERILAEARAAAAMPWTFERQRYYQTVFPQMTRWLPDDEAAQMRLAFDLELRRLG